MMDWNKMNQLRTLKKKNKKYINNKEVFSKSFQILQIKSRQMSNKIIKFRKKTKF